MAIIATALPYQGSPLVIASPLVLAFDGDSITANFGVTVAESYPFKATASLQSTYDSYGVGAQTLVNMDSNILTHLAIKSYDCLILFGGTNDLYAGATGTTTYNRAVALVSKVRGAYPTLPIVFANALPRTNSGTPVGFAAERTLFNSLLAGDDVNFPFLADVGSIAQMQDTTNTTYYLDLVHPTALGHTLIAEVVVPVINMATGRA